MRQENERDIVARAKLGDKSAFVYLLHSHSRWLRRHILIRLPKQYATFISADDILQDTFARAHEQISTFASDSPKAMAVWLRTIAENVIKNHLRAQKTQKRGGETTIANGTEASAFQVAAIHDQHLTPHSALENQEAIIAVKANVEGLPTPQRQALTLVWIENRTLEDTAKLMGRTVSGVRGLIQRAKATLKSALGSSSKWFHQK